jgi:hypothetical protein
LSVSRFGEWTEDPSAPIILHPLLTGFSYPEVAVTVSSPYQNALRAKIANHFDGTLATVGVLVAIGATSAELILGGQRMSIIFVIWFQGIIFWAVRRQCRVAREHLVQKLKMMLQDRVNNQLTVLVGLTDIHAHSPSEASPDDVEMALTAARAVSREIEMLSIESLRSWESRYTKRLPAGVR